MFKFFAWNVVRCIECSDTWWNNMIKASINHEWTRISILVCWSWFTHDCYMFFCNYLPAIFSINLFAINNCSIFFTSKYNPKILLWLTLSPTFTLIQSFSRRILWWSITIVKSSSFLIPIYCNNDEEIIAANLSKIPSITC